MTPHAPRTAEEWESYHELRWRALRAPWNQPRGGDAGEADEDCVHAMISDEAGRAIAVGRIVFTPDGPARIRSVVTAEDCRGRGLGRCMMEHLERAARARGVQTIVLNAREEVAPFYAKLGFVAVGPGPTLFESIRHVAMEKHLTPVPPHLPQP